MDVTNAFLNANISIEEAADTIQDEVKSTSSCDIKILPPTGPPSAPKLFLKSIQKLGIPFVFSSMTFGSRRS
jgi:hypothetical protein